MSERVFGRRRTRILDDDAATERAADLAEALLEEIARAGHDWRAIERLALLLLRLASAMALRAPARRGGTRRGHALHGRGGTSGAPSVDG